MEKLLKKLILFTLLNFNLFAGETLTSVGGVIINLPSGHSFQKAIEVGDAPKNRQCFEEFITGKVSKISFPKSKRTVFEQISDLGYFPEIRLGKRGSSEVSGDRFSFSMRDLGDNWCDEKKQKFVFKKFKKEVIKKVKSVLGKQLVSSLTRLNGDEDLSKCRCSNLSEFKLNERDGIAYFPDGTQVKNDELLSRLFKFFHAERAAKRTRHIIPGTEFLEILGGQECLVRRYKRDAEGNRVLDYCVPKTVSLTSGTDSEDTTEEEGSSSEESEGNTQQEQTQEEDQGGDQDESESEDAENVTRSGDDYAADEIKRQMDLIKSLEKRYETEGLDKKEPKGVYAQLREQLEEIDVQQFSEGENGEIYDTEGNLITNETLIERYYSETSPPDEDVDYRPEMIQGDVVESEEGSHDGEINRVEDESNSEAEEESDELKSTEDSTEDEEISEDESDDLDGE